MKKTFALIIVIALIATLCSCKKINNDVYSSNSESVYSSEISTVTSEIEETDISNIESDDITSNTTVSTPVDNTSSEPVVDNSSKEEPKETSSKEQTTEEKTKEPINFVPKQWPTINSDLTYNYEDTYVSYYNNVFYKGVRYACTLGQSNGVDCSAIVTVGDNDEYLNCVSIIDTDNNERSIFNIYNNRIYYLQFPFNDSRDYTLLNTFSICSMNISGEDKRVEKQVDLSFTHIMTGETSNYLNSKYLFFAVSNLFDGEYDTIYRYNIESNELVKSDYRLDAHTMVYSVEEKVFVWNSDDQKIHEYDIDFKNEKLFHVVDDPHKVNSLVVKLQENGFILSHSKRDDKYFLDFAGNRTEL